MGLVGVLPTSRVSIDACVGTRLRCPEGVCEPLDFSYHKKTHKQKQASNPEGEPKHGEFKFRLSRVSRDQNPLQIMSDDHKYPEREAQSNTVGAHSTCTRVGRDLTPMPNHKFQISPSRSHSDAVAEVSQLSEKSREKETGRGRGNTACILTQRHSPCDPHFKLMFDLHLKQTGELSLGAHTWIMFEQQCYFTHHKHSFFFFFFCPRVHKTNSERFKKGQKANGTVFAF